MKTNTQQINAIAKLAEEKPFDAIQATHFLAREIAGYNKSSDKLIELQKQIDDTKNDKGARKKAIDGLLKELWTNNVLMVEGKGVTKCPIRIALKEVLSKEGLAEKTIANICGAVSYALKEKKPYDIKYLEKKAQQKKIDDAKKEGASSATTPTATTPTATTPTATTPTATTPTATTPTATTPTATTPAKTPNSPLSVAELKTNLNLILPNMILSAKNTRKNCKNEFNNSVLDELISLLNDVSDCVGNLGSGK
jgi:cell division septation protein DedD